VRKTKNEYNSYFLRHWIRSLITVVLITIVHCKHFNDRCH